MDINITVIGNEETENVCGAHVRDVFSGDEWDVRAKCVINATGPFTDSIRKMDNKDAKEICQPASGVHVVLPAYYRYVNEHSLK